MSAKIRSLIADIPGVSISPEVEQGPTAKDGVGVSDSFVFEYEGVTLEANQITAPSMTVNKLEVTYLFPTPKKQERVKLLSVVNAFNKSKVSMKAVLGNSDKDSFQVTFTAEFMCPDEYLVLDMIYPVVSILRTSGKLLVNMLGSHGVVIKGARKNG